jgi:predicted small metal-binding protein
MAKILRCRDAGIDCDFVARGDTDQEVLERTAEHAKADHDVEDPKDYLEFWKKIIRTEETRPGAG